MQSHPMRYTLRGIPSPISAARELPAEDEVRTLQPANSEGGAGTMMDVSSVGWPHRLRQVLGFSRFFGER